MSKLEAVGGVEALLFFVEGLDMPDGDDDGVGVEVS